MEKIKPLTSPDEMISAIRTLGIVPFSKCSVKGWSVQELTHPDFWFTSSDQLGPWDWKVDAVQEGIVYGKFLSNKSAFATEEMYRHLMNWRRSLSKYQIAEVKRTKMATIDDRLQHYIAPALLSAIRESETLDSGELKGIIEREVPLEVRKKVGGYIGKNLVPKVTKQAVDFVLYYLEMGTWTVVGDITRVYRGPNCEYKGWQRNSVTTPEALFKAVEKPSKSPFWVKFIEDEPEDISINCSPAESRDYIINSVLRHFPDAPLAALTKLIEG